MYTWKTKGLVLSIFHDDNPDVPILRISIAEILDIVGRKLITTHLHEIERSKWISAWHQKNDKRSGLS